MRGSPLLRALLTLGALLLLALPLWRVTKARSLAETRREPVSDGAVDASLRLVFLPVAPLEFEVLHLGKSIWRGGGAAEAELPSLPLALPPEGIDLQLRVRWPAGTKSAAARLSVVAGQTFANERHAWSRPDGTLDEVLTFN